MIEGIPRSHDVDVGDGGTWSFVLSRTTILLMTSWMGCPSVPGTYGNTYSSKVSDFADDVPINCAHDDD